MSGDDDSPKFQRRFVLATRREDIDEVKRALLDAMESCNYAHASCFAIRLALEEAISNAVKHGNKNDPDKKVIIDCEIDDSHVLIEITDEGPGFELSAVPDPTAEENLEIPAGRGICLMRSFMTTVEFAPPGNRVRLEYVREDTGSADD